MKNDTALKYILAGIVALALVTSLVLIYSPTRALNSQDSHSLATFVALTQYIRSQPTPADVKANDVPALANLDTVLTDIYITEYITPFTEETPDQVKARLRTLPEEDRFIAAMVESYRLTSGPALLDTIHDLLARYYVHYFTTSDLSGAPAFLERPEIQSLADKFDSSDYAIPEPGAPVTPAPIATSTDSHAEAAFNRFNLQRQELGLDALTKAVSGDDAFIPVQPFDVGCDASVSEYEELQVEDIHAIAITPITGISECGLKVVTYHYVPLAQRMRVEQRVWDCFKQSRDLREASDVSCAGRYTFIERHVKWLPKQVLYTIEEGESLKSKFTSHIPWIEEKLKVKVSEAPSASDANLFLHLGAQSPAGCMERYGCNIFEQVEDKTFATIYISAPDQYFSQVLKHELLHALLPMGHLPQGNYLMSVRPDDPSQTQTLTPFENDLLALYTHPYLRDGMAMALFQRYLVIQPNPNE